MDIHSGLLEILPVARVHTRLIDRIAYANDASYFRLMPQAVVQPNSIGEIQSLFRFTQQQKIPMTFRAAGTSLSGQALSDGLLVDVSKHWGRYGIEDEARRIRFQPGLVGGFINAALRPHRRRIGPDPASIDACMMGGILANNSSGMCCGVIENSYRTIHSMTFVLPNGFTLDTASPNANQIFEKEQTHIAKGLLELAKRIRQNKPLAVRIATRYQMKNTNGYLLNAFLDFETPLDILTHLLIGSEGTLGFIAEAVLNTLPDYPFRYTGQLYFKNIQDAASAIGPIKESGARAAEIMDRAALRSVQHHPGVPSILSQLPDEAAAILVEYQAEDAGSISGFVKEAERVVKKINLLHDPEFTDDPIAQTSLWKTRKGIIPSIGGARAPGTVSINEDVLFPVHRLADAVTDLQHLFIDFDYQDGALFGHAKDGNLHFLINQAFNTDADTRHFDGFVRAMVKLVSGKYDGALKAEHGTGRNMAPFIETEWGAEAYAVMRDLKSLLDPDHMLNPGVMINDNPRAHVSHLKTMTLVSPQVDKCIECGFCEPRCPSRQLTLSPRQRIAVQRELTRLRLAASDSTEIDSVSKDFRYAGIDTCAADGLCATACPVGINTGDYIKHLRGESAKNEKTALWLADHFSFAESSIGMGVTIGHIAQKAIGTKGINRIIRTAEKFTKLTLPKWNSSIPFPSPDRRGRPRGSGEVEFIYFPTCISRQLGTHPSNGTRSLIETFETISQRANINLLIPDDVMGICCGMPFQSKGYQEAAGRLLRQTIQKLWKWSNHGQIPIITDTTSCTHMFRTCRDDLNNEDRILWEQLTFLDGVEFLHDHVMPNLALHKVDEDVSLHPNCSARKLGVDGKMLSIAQRCATSAAVPLSLGCCAFAGDRGLLFPELTRSATEKEGAEVLAHEYDGYYSSNIPCEIGMSESTGKEYRSIAYLVEKASKTSRSRRNLD